MTLGQQARGAAATIQHSSLTPPDLGTNLTVARRFVPQMAEPTDLGTNLTVERGCVPQIASERS